jgi:hypothetical protein
LPNKTTYYGFILLSPLKLWALFGLSIIGTIIAIDENNGVCCLSL